jgi:hypothetical protein
VAEITTRVSQGRKSPVAGREQILAAARDRCAKRLEGGPDGFLQPALAPQADLVTDPRWARSNGIFGFTEGSLLSKDLLRRSDTSLWARWSSLQMQFDRNT